MNLDVLIVDDEPLSRLGVSTRLAVHPDMHIVGECQDGKDALGMIVRLSPDVVFLDIEMPGVSGIELLRALPRNKARCVVFLTAHEEHAVDAFAVEATDFLVKPVNNKRFTACLDRVRRTVSLYRREARCERLYGPLEQPGECLESSSIHQFAVRRGKNVAFVSTDSIDWIEGLGDYAGLHVKSSTHLVRKSLSELASRLDPKLFLRIHRSTIVQIDRIVQIDSLTNRDALATLRDGTVLRASRSYAASLQRLLRNG